MSPAEIQIPPQFTAQHASRWRDRDAARSYRNRAPYPPETFEILMGLVRDGEPRILDLGCGTGAIARALAPRVARVDAIDFASEMIDEGRTLPGGAAPNIAWQVAPAETALLDPPYALIVGGQSLHWMAWKTVLPRCGKALLDRGVLAVVTVEDAADAPWRSGLRDIIARHTTARDYKPFDMLPAWESAGLYRPLGHRLTAPVEFVQSAEEFIDAHHAMSTLTRAHIDAAAFDAELRALMKVHCPDGRVHRTIRGQIEWGRP